MDQQPWTADLRRRLDELLDQHRQAPHDCLAGLREQILAARRPPVSR